VKKNAEKTSHKSYVAVAISEEIELARDYVEMLRNNQIPSRFVVGNEPSRGSQVAIVVPEEFISQAQSLIQARNSGADFYETIYDDLDSRDDETEE
jgi:hypothetical protein